MIEIATPETDELHKDRHETDTLSAYYLMVDNSRRLERERNVLLEAVTRGDSLGNDLIFLLRYSADLLSKVIPIHEMPTVTELKAAADRILQAIQTVKTKP